MGNASQQPLIQRVTSVSESLSLSNSTRVYNVRVRSRSELPQLRWASIPSRKEYRSFSIFVVACCSKNKTLLSF